MGWSFDLHFGNERGERETGRSHERDTQTQTSAPRDEEARPRGLDTRDSTGEAGGGSCERFWLRCGEHDHEGSERGKWAGCSVDAVYIPVNSRYIMMHHVDVPEWLRGWT